ncbi:MAG TPA: hypothetical protein PK306_05070 [Aquabacterium sp.]|nr:hypothetical protein [Aquabacterium sp.]
MTDSSSALIGVLLTSTIGLGALCYLLWRRIVEMRSQSELQRREHDDKRREAVQQAVAEERARAKQALLEAEGRHEAAIEEQKKSNFSVVVHPFVNTEGQKGIFTRETKVEIGYKYQLFVQGLPCFEPHEMVLESTTHKEVDEHMIALLKQKAEQAAESAVLAGSGGTAKTAITIAKAALKVLR